MLQIGLKEEAWRLLQEEGGRTTLKKGSVLKTKGYNLACSVVLHAVVPMWSQKTTASKVKGVLFA